MSQTRKLSTLMHKHKKEHQPVATRTRRFSGTNNQGNSQENDFIKTRRHSKDLDATREDINNMRNGHSISDRLRKVVTIDHVVEILKKGKDSRGEQETKILHEWSFLIPEAEARLKAKLAKNILKERAVEFEEPAEVIAEKADELAKLIQAANYVVIYTGAGISTSASIPDYRGSNGLWTQIKKTGTFSITKIHDLSTAEPTFTHMAIKELCRRRIVNHVVSQNCDGLHLRSGIPQANLSEIHGNMYIEVCPTCEKQYFRQADITERTSRFRHKTGRKCHTCPEPSNNLIDTIVLYGERSRSQWPMNWEKASKAAKRADLIICLGSSLKTLRRYNCLWPKRTGNSGNRDTEIKLAIINLQYTSKDKNSVLKIHGKCDLVMQLVMQRLSIEVPNYEPSLDPLNHLSVPFTSDERTNLKRNLIFESKARLSPCSPDNCSLKRSANDVSNRYSPSLFVSEITDDPEKKKLKMRIRAVNLESNSEPNDECIAFEGSEADNDSITINKDGKDLEREIKSEKKDYAIPGWLGKCLGPSRTNYYKRKRHGNKGKKHTNVLKSQSNEVDSTLNKLTKLGEEFTECQASGSNHDPLNSNPPSLTFEEPTKIKSENSLPKVSLDSEILLAVTNETKKVTRKKT